MATLAPAFQSRKALHRPGKVPTTTTTTRRPSSPASSHSLKRTNSVISLPSPPDEPTAAAPSYLDLADTEDEESEEEVDQLDSDQDDDASTSQRPGGPGNPFLSSRALARQQQQQHADRPDHPQASPTHRAKRARREVDRIQLGGGGGEEVQEKPTVPVGMGRGWEDESNPFIERVGEVRPALHSGKKRGRAGQHEGKEMVTYVFRGKRIHYDLPLSALLAPEDPSSSPFADPSPRLLFPPKSNNPVTPPSRTNPSSRFLDALRATAVKPEAEGGGLPPTPVTEKRVAGAGVGVGAEGKEGGRFGPYKRMRKMKEPEGGLR